MARRGENIYLRKDGRYEGRCPVGKRDNGTTRFKSVYGRRYGEVKAKLSLVRAELDKEPIAGNRYGDGTFGDWSGYWLEVIAAPYIRESSYNAYRTVIHTHLLPAFGGMKLAALGSREIQSWLDGVRVRLAPSTVHNICRVFSGILDKACDKDLIRKNPFKDVKKPKYEVKTPRYLTRTEQKKLEHTLGSENNLEYLLCLYTGLRLGELCALSWEDVDFENSELHIRNAVKRVKRKGSKHTALIIGEPKSTSSFRSVPVPAFLLQILKGMRKSSGFVLESDTGRYIDPRTVQERFSMLCKRAGISGAHMHTLRHTYATRCLEAGIQYETLAALLGHSSPVVTMKCYAHCTEEQKHKEVSKLRPMAA